MKYAFSSFCLFLFSMQVVSAASVIPNDPYFSQQWALRQIHAPEAWAMSTGSAQVVVAVIDTGIDISHPDLRNNIWTNTKEIPGNGIDDDGNGFIDDVHGWNFSASSSDVYPTSTKTQMEDTWSHGTAVASIIAAQGNNGIGMAGVAWNVKIMPIVILDGDGFGDPNDFAKAIDYAIKNGAQVINMSFVGYEDNEALRAAVRRAVGAGVVMVAATGNADMGRVGQDLDQVQAYPVCDEFGRDDVIGVAGSDSLDQPALYGNYGSQCTDLTAPAFELFTARPEIPWPNSTSTDVYGYVEGLSGTSFAAPHVSGAAALIKSLQPTWTAFDIRDRLYHTADPIEAGVAPGQKGKFGYGRLNVERALQGLGPVANMKTERQLQDQARQGKALFEAWWKQWQRRWSSL